MELGQDSLAKYAVLESTLLKPKVSIKYGRSELYLFDYENLIEVGNVHAINSQNTDAFRTNSKNEIAFMVVSQFKKCVNHAGHPH